MGARARLGMLAAAAILAAACADTKVVDSWSDPSVKSMHFNRVLAVFQHRDPGMRRSAEDEMAQRIPNAVASYKLIGDDQVRNIDQVRQRVRSDGFDAAVVMRVAGVERETTYIPPSPSMGVMGPAPYGFWGTWGWGWGMAYDPGYLRTDNVVSVTTRIYSVTDDKLVWSSTSENFNPGSLREVVREVVQANAKKAGDALRKPA